MTENLILLKGDLLYPLQEACTAINNGMMCVKLPIAFPMFIIRHFGTGIIEAIQDPLTTYLRRLEGMTVAGLTNALYYDIYSTFIGIESKTTLDILLHNANNSPEWMFEARRFKLVRAKREFTSTQYSDTGRGLFYGTISNDFESSPTGIRSTPGFNSTWYHQQMQAYAKSHLGYIPNHLGIPPNYDVGTSDKQAKAKQKAKLKVLDESLFESKLNINLKQTD